MSRSSESGLDHVCAAAKAGDTPGYNTLCGEEPAVERLQMWRGRGGARWIHVMRLIQEPLVPHASDPFVASC